MPNYFGVPSVYDQSTQFGYPSYQNRIYPSQIPQPTQQPIQQNPTIPCIQVPNIEYARSVTLNPNQTLYMVSQNSPELYAKATDSMGVATMKTFKLVEFDPTVEAAQQAVNNQSVNFVSREEFNNFVNNVSNQFSIIQQNIIPQPPATQQPQKQTSKKSQPKEATTEET